MAYLKDHYALNWARSYHGLEHWRRVEYNGLLIAQSNDADRLVVSLFAYLHDSCRVNEMRDQDHGYRAKMFIEKELQPQFIHLPHHQLELLTEACAFHTDGLTEADVTVQTCWDADRLDLGRVGIKPRAKFLCTPFAKQAAVIEAAFERSNYPLPD
jgi:uncharacterized protein